MSLFNVDICRVIVMYRSCTCSAVFAKLGLGPRARAICGCACPCRMRHVLMWVVGSDDLGPGDRNRMTLVVGRSSIHLGIDRPGMQRTYRKTVYVGAHVVCVMR